MRILWITDTHGDIDIINRLLLRTRADCAVHCGDFGFYDHDSVDRLSERELRLTLKHSDAPTPIRRQAFELEPDELRQTVRELGLISGFVPYLKGQSRFEKPVYAVWGNHEDIEVVRALRSGAKRVENLTLLDEHNLVDLPEGICLMGIGGNFYLDGDELFAEDMSGLGGKVRASWTQYARLLEAERARPHPARFPIFVSHVSPGKARLIERFALVLGARMVFSGHMNPPTTQVYSLFTICEPQEALARSQADFETLCAAFSSTQGHFISSDAMRCIEASLDALDLAALPRPERGRRAERGTLEHRFFSTQFVNLCEAPLYGVLEIGDRRPPRFTTHG